MALTSASHLSMCLTASKNMRLYCLVYLSVRQYTKRRYNLHDLIEWKNKTNLAFGSPRKLTKTGKLRKSKNCENEQLQNTLEMLSLQSAYYSSRKMNNHTAGTPSVEHIALKANIPEEYPVPEILVPASYDAVENSMLKDTSTSNTSIHGKIPLEMMSDMKTKTSSLKNSNKIENKQQSSLSDFFENVDHIPEHYQHSSNKRDLVSKEAVRDESEIVIPVISPIPTGNNDLPLSYNDSIRQTPPKSKVKPFKSKTLPIEPPVSFDLINQIPLTFTIQSANDELSSKISQFKEDVQSLSLRKTPSVKSILNKTMPELNRFFLNRWRENMIKELGEEGFRAHQEATIKRGINFHANVMELLSGKSLPDIQVMPDNEGHWASLQTAMKDISGVRGLEEDLTHPVLMYRGIMDCIAKYRDVLCVIDWKTSKKPRPLLKNTYDDPVQVAAYMGLVNGSEDNRTKFGKVNHGLLVILYPDGSPAHIHLMNEALCGRYWQDWCERLHLHYQLIYTDKLGGARASNAN